MKNNVYILRITLILVVIRSERKKERKNHIKILGCVEENREDRKKKHVGPTTILYKCINIDINK